MRRNTGSTRRDYIAQIQKSLDCLDNHIGGNPWVECMFRPYANAWANFVFHNSPTMLGVDMEAIQGGDFYGVTGLELEQEDRTGEDESMLEDDLEDDLDEWDTEDDEAMDGDDI